MRVCEFCGRAANSSLDGITLCRECLIIKLIDTELARQEMLEERISVLMVEYEKLDLTRDRDILSAAHFVEQIEANEEDYETSVQRYETLITL